jgi:glycosyltransferase involved in cell wall biosynthesis
VTVWFDVEDLIRFFQGAVRPTGIQRFSFETCSAAARLAGPLGEVRFCRRDTSGLKPIHFPALEAGIRAIAEAPYAPIAPRAQAARQLHPALARLARHVAPQFRRPLGKLARAGMAGLDAARELAWLSLAACRPGARGAPRIGGHAFDLDTGPVSLGHGDWLVNLGASWERPYGERFLSGLHQAGAGFALLAHDLIPDLFPEWCTESMVRDFGAWLDEAVPRADIMFTVSRNTARDLRTSLARHGRRIPHPLVLPAGGPACRNVALLPPVLHEPYVLMVGTIEARKNHAGMLRVWRRLLSTMPPKAVPMLVFAGKPGWLTADLMQQLDNAKWLGGKIRFIDQPPDSTLASLYQHCLFTLFPSFYEGWGLPVSESLSFGKPVAASNRPAITEAGGDFCAYFDPDNLDEAYTVIASLIEHPTRLAALRERIAAGFRAPRWEDTATSLLAALGVVPRVEPGFPEISMSLPLNALPARPAQP